MAHYKLRLVEFYMQGALRQAQLRRTVREAQDRELGRQEGWRCA